MSDQDVTELWDSISGLRRDIGQILTQLSSLTTILSERCESRSSALSGLTTRVKELEDKYHILDKTILRVSIVVGLISAGLSSIATAAVFVLITKFFGA